jgi:hypothetical protein
MSFSDPKLEHLVADMSVAQMLAPRRAGGGVGMENTQGTLDGDLMTTVLSVGKDGRGIPGIINLEGGQASPRFI